MTAFRTLHRNLRVAAWLILLLVMVVGGFERYYVMGWNMPVLTVTVVGLAVLFTVGLFEPLAGTRAEHGIAAWIETTTHFLPLLFFLVLGPTLPSMGRMSRLDYATRSVSNVRLQNDGTPLSVSLLDLHASHVQMDGLPVEVIGTGHILSESERKALPSTTADRDIRAILYRYVITCCAADATTVSAVLKGVESSSLREDQWYRVRGRARYVAEGLNVPFITVESIEPIETPHNPYLSGSDEMFR